jgi:hypothetical protein
MLQKVYNPGLCINLHFQITMNQWKTGRWKKNININVVEEIKENYLWSSKYAEAHVNVLDEVPQSYSHQGNPKPANLRKSKKREGRLMGIFYYLDPDFIKIKYVCYANNSLLAY